MIENHAMPLPANWQNFISMTENKDDLACFLVEELLAQNWGTVIIISGAFAGEETAKASEPDINIKELKAQHEEADTRIVVHCLKSQKQSIVIQAWDTDVLLLLLTHYHQMTATKLWLKAGTEK